MRGGAEKLSELERCECSLYNPVSDLTWERSHGEWGRMVKVEERSCLGEVGGSGVIFFFLFSHTSKFTHMLVPWPDSSSLPSPQRSSLQFVK